MPELDEEKGQWTSYTTTRYRVLDVVKNYLREISQDSEYVGDNLCFFNGKGAPFARVNKDEMRIELSSLAEEDVREMVEYFLETEIREYH